MPSAKGWPFCSTLNVFRKEWVLDAAFKDTSHKEKDMAFNQALITALYYLLLHQRQVSWWLKSKETKLFLWQFVHASSKENIKTRYYCVHVRKIHLQPAMICYDVITVFIKAVKSIANDTAWLWSYG